MTIKTNDSIGSIVAQVPLASEIFTKYDIDFCCGGNRSLAVAIKEQNIDEQKLLTELNQAYEHNLQLKEANIDWQNAPLSQLIDHIVASHHAYLQEALPALSSLTTTILRVHGTNHKELTKVHKLFHLLKMDLEQHLITEEQIVFPLVKQYEESKDKEKLQEALSTIEQLEDEHEGAGDILKELKEITNHYQPPEDGCETYEVTYKGLKELESDIFQHIHLENNILHPRIKKELE